MIQSFELMKKVGYLPTYIASENQMYDSTTKLAAQGNPGHDTALLSRLKTQSCQYKSGGSMLRIL
jgi:hypothetical protein